MEGGWQAAIAGDRTAAMAGAAAAGWIAEPAGEYGYDEAEAAAEGIGFFAIPEEIAEEIASEGSYRLAGDGWEITIDAP